MFQYSLGLIIVCFIAWILTKKLIVETIHKLFLKTKMTWDDILIEKNI
jgi:miniconductance mechanosensitive channel